MYNVSMRANPISDSSNTGSRVHNLQRSPKTVELAHDPTTSVPKYSHRRNNIMFVGSPLFGHGSTGFSRTCYMGLPSPGIRPMYERVGYKTANPQPSLIHESQRDSIKPVGVVPGLFFSPQNAAYTVKHSSDLSYAQALTIENGREGIQPSSWADISVADSSRPPAGESRGLGRRNKELKL
jgi:hypothetical protein